MTGDGNDLRHDPGPDRFDVDADHRTQTATVVVLFTDLVASTALATRLGDDVADELRRQVHQCTARAVSANRGQLVKSLGDGAMAVFTSAVDALRAGAALIDAVRGLRSGNPRVPGLRVGISAGEAAGEGGDWHGRPVVQAARLCAAALGDQILVADVVIALLGSRGDHRFGPSLPYELRGLPILHARELLIAGSSSGDHHVPSRSDDAAPLSCSDEVWRQEGPPGCGPPPLPGALSREPEYGFMGREAELSVANAAWARAREGDATVLLVTGEAGVGKTALAAHVARSLTDALVLHGRCDEDLGVPYQPVVEALQRFVAAVPAPSLPSLLGRHGPEMVRLLPELASVLPHPPPPSPDPESHRYRLLNAVAAWWQAASEHRPLLVVFDDLHWGSAPTLQLLRHIVRWPAPMRLLLIGTIRSGEPDDQALKTVLADLRREGRVRFVDLGRFTAQETAAVVAAASHGAPLSAALAPASIHASTGGNPFFVRELIRHHLEGDHHPDGGAPSGDGGRPASVPPSLRDVIDQRIARLPSTTQRLLHLAAVVGTDFDASTIVAASEDDDEGVAATLHVAVHAGLIHEAAREQVSYRFTHALVRDALYAALGAHQRALLHRRVGTHLERRFQLGDDASLLDVVRHLGEASSADPGLVPVAVRYAVLAAEKASEALAPHSAVELYERARALNARALDAAHRIERDCELLASLGEAQAAAGDPAHRATLLEAAGIAHRIGRADLLRRAALANGRGFFSRVLDVDHERVAVLELALAAPGADDGVRALLVGRLAAELVFDQRSARRFSLSDESLRLARSAGDRRLLADVLSVRFNTIWAPDNLATRLSETAELSALASELRDPHLQWRAGLARFITLVQANRIEEADLHLGAAASIAAQLDEPFLRWRTAYHQAGRALLAGDATRAEALVEEAFTFGHATGQPDAHLYREGQLAIVRAERGGDAPRGEASAPPPLLIEGARALIASRAGDPDAAVPFLDRFEVQFDHLAWDELWLPVTALYAEISHRLGRRALAGHIYDALSPYRDQLITAGAVACIGSTEQYLGLLQLTLDRPADALEHLARAVESHQHANAPLLTARSERYLASAHRRLGDPGTAEVLEARAASVGATG